MRPRNETEEDERASLSSQALSIVPSGQHRSSLIWLHALGETPESLRGLFQTVRMPHTKLILPRAPLLPITALQDQEERAWYDLLEPEMAEGMREDEAGIDSMAARLQELIEEESLLVDSGRIVIAGAAQGGALAVHVALGLKGGRSLAGAVCISGYVPLLSRYPQRIGAGNRTPVLVVHGKADRAVEWEWARRGWDRLEASGVKVERRVESATDHQLSMHSFHSSMDWADERMRK
jgi:predicted esterase